MTMLFRQTRYALVISLAGCFATPPLAADSADHPTTTRKVVLEKAIPGYRWKLIEAPVPALGRRQVLVHVRAVALNHGDLDLLKPDPSADMSGRVVASDGAGDVIAVGKDVSGFRKGMRVTSLYFNDWTGGPFTEDKVKNVHGWTMDGVLGDYIVLDDTAVARAPAGLSYEEAATLPTAGLTAWTAVTANGQLDAGDVVVVQGTGGVSTFAALFASAMGARVIVTSSSDDKLRRMQSLGTRDGINYHTHPDWSDKVLELTQGRGADLVIDVGGKDTLAHSVTSLAFGGALSIVGGLSGYEGKIPSLGLLMKNARARGIFVGSRADYQRMAEFIATHRLHPVINRVYPLEQGDEALRLLAAGNFVGKVVLRLAPAAGE